MSKVIDVYLEYHNQYKKLYGDMIVVLIQIGSFYEIMSITKSPDLEKLSIITNLRIGTRNHLYFIGFPIAYSDKYLNLLTNNGFTVVFLDKLGPSNQSIWIVDRIYSPSINDDDDDDDEIPEEFLCISI